MIFGKSLLRIADSPDPPSFNICNTAHIIDDLPRFWIHEETVDGKVPAVNILSCRGKGNLGGMAAILVFRLFPVGGDLMGMVTIADEDHAETDTHGIGPGKKGPNHVRAGGGHDIVILRGLTPEEIPNTAADEKRLMAGETEVPHNAERSLTHHPS